jgi:hypothetical protein
MVETIHSYPKNSKEREMVAEQLKSARFLDRSHGQVTDRSMSDYLNHLLGLRGSFAYMQALTESNTVLDLGSGTTKAISQLAASQLGEGLEFRATNLSGSISDFHLPIENIKRTSVEVLNGIPDNSLAGVIGCYSIGYTTVPELTASRIDQTLIDGGIIKTNFQTVRDVYSPIPGFQTHERFTETLLKLGYDVFIEENYIACDIVIAKKPRGPLAISASELAKLDDRYNGYIYKDKLQVY